MYKLGQTWFAQNQLPSEFRPSHNGVLGVRINGGTWKDLERSEKTIQSHLLDWQLTITNRQAVSEQNQVAEETLQRCDRQEQEERCKQRER